MKGIKALIIIIYITCFLFNIQAQNYHLIFETDIFSIDLSKAAVKDSTVKYTIVKGQHHIITFENKKAIGFQLDTLQTNKNIFFGSPNGQNRYLIVDNKKGKYQWVLAGYNKNTKKPYVNAYDKKAWLDNDPSIEPAITEDYKFILEVLKTKYDTIPKWKAPEITYTEQTKEINGYLCKHATVLSNNQIHSVWFTEEINFNWCFDDYRVLIAGTAIQIEHNCKTTFELLELKLLDYDKLPIRKEVFHKLRRLK